VSFSTTVPLPKFAVALFTHMPNFLAISYILGTTITMEQALKYQNLYGKTFQIANLYTCG
jgi:hypothetical protein